MVASKYANKYINNTTLCQNIIVHIACDQINFWS